MTSAMTRGAKSERSPVSQYTSFSCGPTMDKSWVPDPARYSARSLAPGTHLSVTVGGNRRSLAKSCTPFAYYTTRFAVCSRC
eukprot:3880344-Pyramimonas_sp.AAC.1